MDIGRQKRVIMVEPLDLPAMETESEQGAQQPQGGHARHQDPGKGAGSPTHHTAHGQGRHLDPSGRG